jgi:hypothetical protein
MVALTAGEDRHPPKYLLHRECTFFYSPELKAFSSGDIQIEDLRVCKIGGYPKEIVRLLEQWVYRHEVCCASGKDDHCGLLELWDLADTIGIPSLQNMVIDKLASIPEYERPELFVLLAYEARNGYVLRKFALAKCAPYLTPNMFRELYAKKEFVLDYISYIHDKRIPLDSSSWSISASDYYVFED